MIGSVSVLVTLVCLVDAIPPPPPPPTRGPGAPRLYPDRLFLQALVVMIVRHLHTINELLTVLDQPTAEMRTLRALLMHEERFPTLSGPLAHLEAVDERIAREERRQKGVADEADDVEDEDGPGPDGA